MSNYVIDSFHILGKKGYLNYDKNGNVYKVNEKYKINITMFNGGEVVLFEHLYKCYVHENVLEIHTITEDITMIPFDLIKAISAIKVKGEKNELQS